MLLLGLQKLTLLDFPGKMACTVFTGGCDFRCPFCHNASLVRDVADCVKLSEQEFFDFLNKRKGILQGVCITGGEPTLQPDLKDFIIKIRDMGYSVKLDTNGNNPNVLKELIDEGLLDYIAMDIKNSQSKYSLTAGVDVKLENIIQSIELLKQEKVDYEFRTTVVKELHEESDFHNIGAWLKGARRYFLQGFVDSGDILCDGYSGYDKETLNNLLKITKQYVPTAELRGV